MTYLPVTPGTIELELVSTYVSTNLSTPQRAGGRIIDLSTYPAVIESFTRSVAFKADLETTAGTCHVTLHNVTSGEDVTGAVFTTTNTTNTEISGTLTVGVAAGNLKTGEVYEVTVWITGGSVADRAVVTNARLSISYA